MEQITQNIIQEYNFLEILSQTYVFDNNELDNNQNYNNNLQNEIYLCEINMLNELNHYNNIVENNLTCAVCFTDFYSNLTSNHTNNDICIISCNHYFHKKCINEWLKIQNNCPLCRKKCKIYNKNKKEFISDNNNFVFSLYNNEEFNNSYFIQRNNFLTGSDVGEYLSFYNNDEFYIESNTDTNQYTNINDCNNKNQIIEYLSNNIIFYENFKVNTGTHVSFLNLKTKLENEILCVYIDDESNKLFMKLQLNDIILNMNSTQNSIEIIIQNLIDNQNIVIET